MAKRWCSYQIMEWISYTILPPGVQPFVRRHIELALESPYIQIHRNLIGYAKH